VLTFVKCAFYEQFAAASRNSWMISMATIELPNNEIRTVWIARIRRATRLPDVIALCDEVERLARSATPPAER
jgi:hypothetical protein